MALSLRQLRYFVATAEHGEVSAAAKALSISQPSVSAAIADMEALLIRPAEGIQALAFVVGTLFVVEGVMKLIYSWHWRSQPKIGWLVASGILSIAIAMILLGDWPQQSAALLGILVGINLLASGTVALLLGFRASVADNTEHNKNDSES